MSRACFDFDATSLALRILKTLISGILDDLNSMFMVKYAVIEIQLFMKKKIIVQFACLHS